MDAELTNPVLSPDQGLLGPQRALYDALTKKYSLLAQMYVGAIMILRQPDNPERLPLAAHSLRELMEKIPVAVDVHTPAHAEPLMAKLREVEDQWLATYRATKCHQSDEMGWCNRSAAGYPPEEGTRFHGLVRGKQPPAKSGDCQNSSKAGPLWDEPAPGLTGSERRLLVPDKGVLHSGPILK